MQTIIERCNHLKKATPFKERYPNYDLQDEKVHILYVSPRLRPLEYYSSILPALELNKTKTHSAILSSIELDESITDFFEYVDTLDVRLLKWAHYIVFPTILTDMTYLVKILRLLHPHLQIVMHLDKNYHKIPSWHNNYGMINSDVKDQLITNINLLDICICKNGPLKTQYHSAVEFYHKNVKCHLTTMPTFISRTNFENLKHTNYQKVIPANTNIGVFNPSKKFLESVPMLLRILHKKGHKVYFIVFEYEGDKTAFSNNSQITFFKKVNFVDYFQHLLELQLCMALFNVSEYSSYDPTHYYLEVSAMGIASIACKEHPASSIINKLEAGLIVLDDIDWEVHITTLLEQENFRKQLALHSMKMIWRDHSFTRKSLKEITSIFN